jgi:hypothetical protein
MSRSHEKSNYVIVSGLAPSLQSLSTSYQLDVSMLASMVLFHTPSSSDSIRYSLIAISAFVTAQCRLFLEISIVHDC